MKRIMFLFVCILIFSCSETKEEEKKPAKSEGKGGSPKTIDKVNKENESKATLGDLAVLSQLKEDMKKNK